MYELAVAAVASGRDQVSREHLFLLWHTMREQEEEKWREGYLFGWCQRQGIQDMMYESEWVSLLTGRDRKDWKTKFQSVSHSPLVLCPPPYVYVFHGKKNWKKKLVLSQRLTNTYTDADSEIIISYLPHYHRKTVFLVFLTWLGTRKKKISSVLPRDWYSHMQQHWLCVWRWFRFLELFMTLSHNAQEDDNVTGSRESETKECMEKIALSLHWNLGRKNAPSARLPCTRILLFSDLLKREGNEYKKKTQCNIICETRVRIRTAFLISGSWARHMALWSSHHDCLE